MSGAAQRPVSRARRQEIGRSDGLLHKRVVAAINLITRRPAAAASPTGSGIMGMSSPRTIGSARGCRSTSSTSCRRRAVVKARATRPPTARAEFLGRPHPAPSGRARSALCLYIYLLTTYYYGTCSLRRRRRATRPTPHRTQHLEVPGPCTRARECRGRHLSNRRSKSEISQPLIGSCRRSEQ